MKNLVKIAALLIMSSFLQAQIIPTDSPYYGNGPYTVVSDSTTVGSKKVLMYRPNLPPVGKYPVLMFQPGANGVFGGDINVHTYDLFLQHLTTYGFVVLVLDETSAGMGMPSGTFFKDVHTWFKNQVANTSHWLNTYADPTKVVVGGHSNGGVNASGLLVDRPTEIHGIVYFASYPSSSILYTQDVSGYSGKVLSIAGSEDNSSTPAACKTGFDAFTSSTCKTYTLIQGLGHGGFGDYQHNSQVVGSIGRDNATASIRHYLLSFMLSQFKSDPLAFNNMTVTALQPNTIGEFITNCGGNTVNIMQMSDVDGVVVYPNPASTLINIKNLPENAIVHIYDIKGALVYAKHIETENKATADVSVLPQGSYILKVFSNTHNTVKKINILK